ncbi:hypothetical protein BC939DRAFT_497196 [Gamsiella multidivaricata]|uniref:uncharacterized protein n=1 Tax=Gamsiella multidivaricata TaxID=101098 RepID=UPI002220603E|nr:uncharacterized protein BC939DRAFT_497196 [Gamsiella multidivaricata]KAG0369869.1 hypothetical protein BGZ54_008607 [Gamsiella multidivaricata]KAI7816710.1 hypothetical protein BC939DRAFT_497196 [Gamsiella multidivaricata]
MEHVSKTTDERPELTNLSTFSSVPTAGNAPELSVAEAPTPQEPLPLPSSKSGIKQRLQLSQNRLLSLDLLRGLAILIMIVCNAQIGDTVFFILEHPAWIGFTIADTVFPSFLFITGCTMPLSVRADPNPGPGSHYYRSQALRVFKRSVIIWLLGVVLNLYGLVQLHVGADKFRWPNVLNRIGFCYLIVGWMHVLVLARGRIPEKPLSSSYLYSFNPQTNGPQARPLGFEADAKKDYIEDSKTADSESDHNDSGAWSWFLRVTLPYYLPASCLFIWLICTYTVQVEGCPERAMIRDPACSPQAYFDLKVFGTAHTYRHLNFDPEGSLSTLTSILNVWFGWFIGCTVRSLNAQVKQTTNDFKAWREARGNAEDQESLVQDVLEQEMITRIYNEHLSQWFWWGILWMFTGWVFSLGLPLSKPSWTATYAVLAAGVSQTVLSILFYKFDAQPKTKRLVQVYLEHQGFRSNNQLSRHYRHRDTEQGVSVPARTRTNYSSALNMYYKVDHFLRHWFRKAILVVLGSMGRNAILMYMCSELVQGTCSLIPGGTDPATGDSWDLCTSAFSHTWGALDIGGWGSLFYSLGFAALHVLLAIFLDYKKWYFKI